MEHWWTSPILSGILRRQGGMGKSGRIHPSATTPQALYACQLHALMRLRPEETPICKDSHEFHLGGRENSSKSFADLSLRSKRGFGQPESQIAYFAGQYWDKPPVPAIHMTASSMTLQSSWVSRCRTSQSSVNIVRCEANRERKGGPGPMKDEPLVDPAHKKIRGFLRTVGPLLVVVGMILSAIGLFSFFRSFGTFEFPRYFWCCARRVPADRRRVEPQQVRLSRGAPALYVGRGCAGEQGDVQRPGRGDPPGIRDDRAGGR